MSTQSQLDHEPQDALSRRLTQALEAPRAFTLPANFAARTAAAAAQLPTPVGTPTRVPFAIVAIRIAFVVLGLAMVALAAWSRNAPDAHQLVVLGTEIGLALEFVALTTWLSLRPPQAH
jgi:hypothetical protein